MVSCHLRDKTLHRCVQKAQGIRCLLNRCVFRSKSTTGRVCGVLCCLARVDLVRRMARERTREGTREVSEADRGLTQMTHAWSCFRKVTRVSFVFLPTPEQGLALPRVRDWRTQRFHCAIWEEAESQGEAARAFRRSVSEASNDF